MRLLQAGCMNVCMAPKFKGNRDAMMTRPPMEVGQILRARAIRAGVPYGDIIAAILSEYVGLSYLCPMPDEGKGDDQQEFELPRSA